MEDTGVKTHEEIPSVDTLLDWLNDIEISQQNKSGHNLFYIVNMLRIHFNRKQEAYKQLLARVEEIKSGY